MKNNKEIEILLTETIVYKAILDIETNIISVYNIQSNEMESIYDIENNKHLNIIDYEIEFN